MGEGPILVIAGTNRPDANALKVASIVMSHYAAASISAELYSLSEMPAEMFDPKCYAQKPAAWQDIQKRVLDSRGLHIITPEYNGSFPGVLKYFVDMLKFPESFQAKPVAFVGEAAGIWGAIRSVEQLQMIFAYRNAFNFPDRVFIPQVNKALDSSGQLIDKAIDQRIAVQTKAFDRFTRALTGVAAPA